MPNKLIIAPPTQKSWNFSLFLNLANEITRNLRSVRQTAWFIEVHLQALTSKSSQIQKFIELMNIGCNFFLVKQFMSFSFQFLILRCSQRRKGISKIVTVVYLHEFLVKDSDRTSPISQQGTKDAKRLLRNKTPHAKNELTQILELNSQSSDAIMRLILSYFNTNILGLFPDSAWYMAWLVPVMFDCRLANCRESLSLGIGVLLI